MDNSYAILYLVSGVVIVVYLGLIWQLRKYKKGLNKLSVPNIFSKSCRKRWRNTQGVSLYMVASRALGFTITLSLCAFITVLLLATFNQFEAP